MIISKNIIPFKDMANHEIFCIVVKLNKSHIQNTTLPAESVWMINCVTQTSNQETRKQKIWFTLFSLHPFNWAFI